MTYQRANDHCVMTGSNPELYVEVHCVLGGRDLAVKLRPAIRRHIGPGYSYSHRDCSAEVFQAACLVADALAIWTAQYICLLLHRIKSKSHVPPLLLPSSLESTVSGGLNSGCYRLVSSAHSDVELKGVKSTSRR